MYGGANFTLWGISQNHPKDTRKFMQQFNIKFPVLIDGKGYPASNRYGLTNSPTLFLILPGGRIQISCALVFRRSTWKRLPQKHWATSYTAFQTGGCGALREAR
jgi:AhpC/TSA family